MKIFKINHSYNLLVKAALLSFCGLAAGQALACPVVYFTNQVERLNTTNDQDGKTIYFCKQEGFTPSQLQYSLQPNSLLPGGNKVISMGSAIQKSTLAGSINLIGPGPTPLSLTPVMAKTNFPNGGGFDNKSALFNFYTRVNSSGADKCTGASQYNIIRNYLRSNPRIFQSNERYPSSSGLKVGTAITTGNDLAIIRDAEIRNGDSYLKADITFYHVNAGGTGQFFTDTQLNKQFCWVGVGTKIDIRDDATNINKSGDYLLDIGVNVP